jgi:hypothetical protein
MRYQLCQLGSKQIRRTIIKVGPENRFIDGPQTIIDIVNSQIELVALEGDKVLRDCGHDKSPLVMIAVRVMSDEAGKSTNPCWDIKNPCGEIPLDPVIPRIIVTDFKTWRFATWDLPGADVGSCPFSLSTGDLEWMKGKFSEWVNGKE